MGLRTLELVREKDRLGTSFYFRLNGVPVFMKGANYIPPDNFLSRVTRGKYKQIIENAAKVNMNMLRVWGGGVYPDQVFYDLCDQNGILVWQDFMFACAMYPGDADFQNNVKAEVNEQVERLRNHACLALWCGNNEVDEGWKNWGWQKQYHYQPKDSQFIEQSNGYLFQELIPGIIRNKDPHRHYWPSSPSIGWGHQESLQSGDAHYWGVWWGNEPFSAYDQKVGRFMSEFGFQGIPDLQTLRKAGLRSKGKSLSGKDSIVWLAHQKHPKGYQTIEEYMIRDYPLSKDLEKYTYVSQLLQARGMKTAIEAHRRAKPYCMGSLYWQLNDCWPVTSWSSVEYDNRWKALHYQIQRSFADILISIEETDSNYRIYLISDQRTPIHPMLKLQLIDFKGTLLWSDSVGVELAAKSARVCYLFSKTLLNPYNLSTIVLVTSLQSFPETRSLYYFVKPRDLILPRTPVSVTPGNCGDTPCITLSADGLIKDLFLSTEGDNIRPEDNFFDLLPGETRTIRFSSPLQKPEKPVRVLSLQDLFGK